MFVRNPQITSMLAERALERAEAAGEVLVEETRKTIRGGTEDDRSQPGEAPRSQSGELEESVRILSSSQDGSRARVRVGTDLIKGWWLEFGTAVMAPRPWLRPSFESAKPRMIEQFRGLVNG